MTMEPIPLWPNLLFNLLLVVVWLAPIIMALWRLRERDLPETARAVWTLVIVAIPIIGPLAFLLVNAARRDGTE